jgi:hypothetical protein
MSKVVPEAAIDAARRERPMWVESTYSLELTVDIPGCRSSECLQRSF